MNPTRRDLLAAGGAIAMTPGLASAQTDGSLARAARDKGLRFGSAIGWCAAGADRGGIGNPRYTRLIARDCGMIVAENEMKWQALRPTPDIFAFDRADAIVAFAKRRDIAVRGHNLLWHQPKWLPRWLNEGVGATTAREADRTLARHIATVCRRYSGRIKDWDVVNEAVRPEDGELYETTLSRALGGAKATLDLAFRRARATLPRARLVYNDYMSWEPGSQRHRAGVLRLLAEFRRRGTPVDALGVQSHLVTLSRDAAGDARTLEPGWRRFLEEVTAMGYDLLITELDVRDNALPADIGVRDRAVADFTRDYLEITLSFPQLRDVLIWGLCDRYSWIEGFEPRTDHVPRRPSLYDDRFQAKPMRDAVLRALQTAPARPRLEDGKRGA